MKTPLRSGLLVLSLFASLLVSVADTTTVVPLADEAPSADGVAAGSYVGTYQSGGEGGDLRIKLTSTGAAWSADVSFTFQGEEAPSKVTSVKVDGAKIELVLEWTVQGTQGQSRLIGTVSGNKLEGTYTSTTAESANAGTWTVVRT